MHYFIALLMCLFINEIRSEKCTSFQQKIITKIPEKLANVINNTFGSIINRVLNKDKSIIESIYEKYINASNTEDKNLNITQLLNKYGYPVEQHEVTTSDGYILTMFRIPNNGPPVLLMHGALSSSDDFLTIGSNSGLGYLLADAGYDVWLGNARGNQHSRRHITLSPSCAEFWDFSWDEHGRYDLPAKIDYILNKTGEEQLIFVSHSMGSTMYFVCCSSLPEYNAKIKLMVALSAVAFNIGSPLLRIFSPANPVLTELAKAVGLYELLPRNALLQYLTDTFCGTPATATLVCGNILFLFAGADYSQVNATALPVIFGHYPAGMGTKVALHYGQLALTGKFSRYDYGFFENLIMYGSLTPPDYELDKITSPVAIYYATKDRVTPQASVDAISSRLGNVVKLTRVPYDDFSHADFLFARDVKELLYDDVLDLIYKYSQP
ncbi:lipase 3-like [Galleria mellonella]|uniref:Lipase n=1 Tax=Galleria mellonella TaxID=7137 RepID=A0A6J3CA75_GALME|nr:lipase 3-like [Galleria mellonella]